MTRNASIIAITSGKSGVGKTHIAANLGILLAKQGKRICIIDANYGFGNINLILGIAPTSPPPSLFKQDFEPNTAMINTDLGVDILPTMQGIDQPLPTCAPSKAQVNRLLQKLKPYYDVILVDTTADINRGVRNYLAAADHAFLVVTSDPSSLTDAFGLIRKMKKVQSKYTVIVNRVSNAAAATAVYKRFAIAVRKYIGTPINAIGYIKNDSFISAAALSQTAVVSYSPNCLASRCLKRIALGITKKLANERKIVAKKITPIVTVTAPNLVKEKVNVAPDPFNSWLVQLRQFLDTTSATEKAVANRKREFILELDKLCGSDESLLNDIEAMVVKNSFKKSQNDNVSSAFSIISKFK